MLLANSVALAPHRGGDGGTNRGTAGGCRWVRSSCRSLAMRSGVRIGMTYLRLHGLEKDTCALERTLRLGRTDSVPFIIRCFPQQVQAGSCWSASQARAASP